MTLLVTASIPLLFRLIATGVCAQNQVIQPGVNLCYSIRQSQMNPQGVDTQVLDNAAEQYLQTRWFDDSTMLSRVESPDGTCYQWLNDDWQATTTCEFDTNPDVRQLP